ncbi:short-chain dehydrogenase reductase sdr protein [Diplodia corticola]|uniref:Short-chain dehydrogenase reductase sdr protein n=1 Tax=Diplodia corticola TaxID=236234 RepID=A0A1J9QQV3_9PEZI|nr:short-chain dehydrogenase reductase sdr protein [Diplodia corticola]OJD30394.1 short-chain dehydrogenase reductase sdr protein [Diplodia corticola]
MAEIKIRDQDFQNLRGKVIIITGGSSGIGLATVSLALEAGAKVVIGDLNPAPPHVNEHANCTYVPLDVTSWAALSEIFEKAFELHGRIDHVFANAGVGPRTNLLEDKVDSNGKPVEPDYSVIDINLKSVLNTTALALHYMKKQQPAGGSIVLTASASSFQRFPTVDYTTAKHGVLGLLRSLAPTLRLSPAASSLPIRINAIAPQWTATGIVPGAAIRAAGAYCMQPADPARSALYLMASGDGAHARNGALVFSQAVPRRDGSSGTAGDLDDDDDDVVVEYKEIDDGMCREAAALCGVPGPDLGEVLVRMLEARAMRASAEAEAQQQQGGASASASAGPDAAVPPSVRKL